MSELYALVGTCRQAHHIMYWRRQHLEERLLLLSEVMAQERSKHPSMSLKKMYHRLQPDFIGRDAFIDYSMENGFEPVFAFKKPQLTRSSDLLAYPNLLHGKKILDINQVWASDITYFKVAGKWCYIVLIEDLCSRRIIGYCAAQNLFAQANMMALNMAFQTRGLSIFNRQLIHHSDRGSQYRSHEYTQALNQAQIQISMAYSCFDNAYMESTNGIIKNEYLKHRPIKSFEDLLRYLQQDVALYNNERPHGSLRMKTPAEFESYIFNIPISQRTFLKIFTDKSKQHNLLILQPDNQQLTFQFP